MSAWEGSAWQHAKELEEAKRQREAQALGEAIKNALPLKDLIKMKVNQNRTQRQAELARSLSDAKDAMTKIILENVGKGVLEFQTSVGANISDAETAQAFHAWLRENGVETSRSRSSDVFTIKVLV